MTGTFRNTVSKTGRNNRTNYFEIDNVYVTSYARHLGPVATAVYTSLCKHADYDTKRCWPSMQTIAEQHGIERHAVSRALAKLEAWNIISTARAIDRKGKKRRNNVYTIITKELWKKIPTTTTSENDHGILNTVDVGSKIPHSGTESSSNKTQIIKTPEENSHCGALPTMIDRPNQPGELNNDQKKEVVEKMEKVALAVWNSDSEITKLWKSDYRDYKIIALYFHIAELIFDDKVAFEEGFKRSLKAANLLKKYKLKMIKLTMEWCRDNYDPYFWTLETVLKSIDDCITYNFVPRLKMGVLAHT